MDILARTHLPECAQLALVQSVVVDMPIWDNPDPRTCLRFLCSQFNLLNLRNWRKLEITRYKLPGRMAIASEFIPGIIYENCAHVMCVLGREFELTDPLDELLTYAERSYLRLEAEQLIRDCMDQGDPSAFNRLLEELVIAGSHSLLVLREILETIRSIMSDLSQEGLSVRQDLMDAMAEFGLFLPQLLSVDAPESFRQICSQGLRIQISEMASKLAIEDEDLLDEICTEASERVTSIARGMSILMGFENSVMDWMEGLAYEVVHAPQSAEWFNWHPMLQ